MRKSFINFFFLSATFYHYRPQAMVSCISQRKCLLIKAYHWRARDVSLQAVTVWVLIAQSYLCLHYNFLCQINFVFNYVLHPRFCYFLPSPLLLLYSYHFPSHPLSTYLYLFIDLSLSFISKTQTSPISTFSLISLFLYILVSSRSRWETDWVGRHPAHLLRHFRLHLWAYRFRFCQSEDGMNIVY